ncbi:hypothetical protein Indivirus_5_38 [Indivirus ILV1]|uniref:Endonuclease/exonuclease/phosphatase family protein n=1 Tax=Indivirus ILV1 TaxID=1977633 RepID=A0A1V0SDY0_9VIRU|nr:hypothetical protein Indivirus_5_38 [Indivirus ILV1]
MSKIRILFSNVGLDKWPNNDKYIKNVDTAKYSENTYSDIDNTEKSTYNEIGKLNISGLYHPRKDYENPYKYGCYLHNKAFDAYLKNFFKNVDDYISFDAVIFQEFCGRYVDLFNFNSYFMQQYNLPTLFDYLNITNDEKNKSKKAFLVGSKNNNITIVPFNVNDYKKTKITNESGENSLDTGYGNIQISKLIDHKNRNREICIINLHNRYKENMDNFRDSLIIVLEKIKNMNDILFVGDFNRVFQFADLIKSYGLIYCQNKFCNLPILYDKINRNCNKNFKLQNLQIYYKLSGYNISLDYNSINCDFDKNVSSHIFVDITLLRKKYKLSKN